jgi:hypothetical protein
MTPTTAPHGIRCAATRQIDGLRNSIGYLVPAPDRLVFVTRRQFQWRHYPLDYGDIQTASWRRGLLMHRLTLRTAAGEHSFYVFRSTPYRSPAAGV